MAGRKRTPVAIAKARGMEPRYVNDDAPEGRDGVPTCPRWLSKEAKRCWRETIRELKHLGVLTKADRQALTAYCDTWGRWRMAVRILNERGHTTAEGRLRPEVNIAKNLVSLLKSYQSEFGLTPAARSAMGKTAASGKLDELEAFMDEGFKLRAKG